MAYWAQIRQRSLPPCISAPVITLRQLGILAPVRDIPAPVGGHTCASWGAYLRRQKPAPVGVVVIVMVNNYLEHPLQLISKKWAFSKKHNFYYQVDCRRFTQSIQNLKY